MRKDGLWTWTFVALVGANFFTGLVFFLLATTIAGHAMEKFGVDSSLAGIAVGAYAMGAVIFRLLTGRYMAILGRRRLACGGTVLYALLTLTYLAAGNFWLLTLARFIHGAAFGVCNTALNTIAAEVIPPDKQGEGTAFLTLSPTMATAIGPLAGLLLMQRYPYEVVLWVCFGCSVLAAAALLGAGVRPDGPVEHIAREPFRLQAFFDVSVLPVGLMMLIMAMSYAAITSFMSAYAGELGLSQAASLFFVVYAAVILIARPCAGMLLDRASETAVIVPASVSFAAGFLLLGNASSGAVLLASAALFALGYGSLHSTGHAVSVKHAPPERTGVAVATYYVCADLGVALGPPVWGTAQTLLGYRGMYLLQPAAAAAALALYVLLRHRARKKYK